MKFRTYCELSTVSGAHTVHTEHYAQASASGIRTVKSCEELWVSAMSAMNGCNIWHQLTNLIGLRYFISLSLSDSHCLTISYIFCNREDESSLTLILSVCMYWWTQLFNRRLVKFRGNQMRETVLKALQSLPTLTTRQLYLTTAFLAIRSPPPHSYPNTHWV